MGVMSYIVIFLACRLYLEYWHIYRMSAVHTYPLLSVSVTQTPGEFQRTDHLDRWKHGRCEFDYFRFGQRDECLRIRPVHASIDNAPVVRESTHP